MRGLTAKNRVLITLPRSFLLFLLISIGSMEMLNTPNIKNMKKNVRLHAG